MSQQTMNENTQAAKEPKEQTTKLNKALTIGFVCCPLQPRIVSGPQETG